MATYMDLGQFKDGHNGKSRFIKLGYAKEDGKGGHYLNFDALPLPDDQGRVSVRMIPQRDRNEGYGSSNSQPPTSGSSASMAGGEIDQDIPFGPEVR